MVLDVSDVADMEFRAGKLATFKTAAGNERFFGDDAGELCPAVLQIVSDRRAIVKLLLLDVFQLFVVPEEVCILAMKWLVSKPAIGLFEVVVREEKSMKHDLAKLQIADRFVPG